MANVMATVDELMKAGGSTTVQTWAYNDASLRISRLAQLIQKTTTLSLDTPSAPPPVTITPGCVLLTLVFNSLPVTEHETGKLIVKLFVMEAFANAWLAMHSRVMELVSDSVAVSALADFEVAGGSSASPPASHSPGGHCLLSTASSALYLRGNIFAELAVQGSDSASPTPASLDIILGALKRCDGYLARRVVRKSQIRRPILTFAQGVPLSVPENSTFTITLRDDNYVTPDLVVALSDQVDLIEPGDFNKETRSYTFRVLQKKGPAQPDQATVTFAAAHADTLHPGSKAFTVTLQ